MNTKLKTKLSAWDSRFVTPIEPGSATPLVPAVAPNGDAASSTWWDHIKSLDHYDPAYPYDPQHVYGPDWTDDDAYGKDGVTFMAAPSHRTSINGCFDEAQRLLGSNKVFSERCLKLLDLDVPKTNRYARSGQIIPDVFIQARPRPEERRHEIAYDPDNPILFVLEVLSESTFHHDLGPKIEIYRAMEVREFWHYDPERWHRQKGESRLWGLRLSADDAYEDIEPVRYEDGQPVYRSDVLGEFRMLDEGGDVHTLQTWDATRGIWLDPQRVSELTVQAPTRANVLALLTLHVEQGGLASHVPDALAEAWERTRWVPNPADVLNVLTGSGDWTSLLPPEDAGT